MGAISRDGAMQPKTPQLIQRTDGICRETERRIITGVPRSSWYALQEKGLAPKPVRLGPRSVGWARAALLSWVEARIADVGEGAWQPLGAVAQRIIDKAGR
jgi:predicted DNA-binding transcriptional regulator AlpA